MTLATTVFKVRLAAIPRIKKSKDSQAFENFGEFTLKKKYPVYSVYAGAKSTQFLVTDDTGTFMWVGTSAFKR